MENPFGITREEVLNLAAKKLADASADSEYIEGLARTTIEARIERMFKESITTRVEQFLAQKMEEIMRTEIVPVDMWGERTGPPTTIRDSLAARAKDFWITVVDSEGNPSKYGGKPRYEQVFGKIVRESFAQAITQDMVNVVGAIKDAMIEDCNATVRAKIDELIRVKTKK